MQVMPVWRRRLPRHHQLRSLLHLCGCGRRRCYVTPKRYAPVAAQRELLLASCTTEHHVHLGGGGGYRPQRVGFTLFGLSSGRRAVLAMRLYLLTLYLLTMCPSPNSARLSCAQRNADVALAVAPDVLHRCGGAQVCDQWDSFGECPLPFRFIK